MAKKKVYAVRKGKVEGIFETWEECKASVDGYPSAEYKSFATKDEALVYLGGETVSDAMVSLADEGEQEGNCVVAYVDGSFDEKIGKYAFGCIMILPSGEIIRESGNGNNPESIALRNVTGEMLGAMFVVKWCIENRYSSVKICYDYSGIEMWATGQWKAKTNLTKKYVDFMKDNTKKIQVSFQKIEAHTGDKYNEEADRLAKAALTEGKGIPKIKKGEFWFTVEGILWSDILGILEIMQDEFSMNNFQKEDQPNPYGHSVVLKMGKGEKIVIKHYDKGEKVVMQGKPQKLFETFVAYVAELVEVERLPQIYRDTYNIEINKDEVRSEFQYYMPNSYDKLPEKMSRTLHQAVCNLKLTGDMFDGTYLAQPVIRAIDGHLKMILRAVNIIPNAQYIKEHNYDMFEKTGAKYKLSAARMGTATTEQAKYIGNCYTFFVNNRHELSHWDDPTDPLDTTKLLDVEGAHSLIKRTLALIDEYYE